MDQIRNELDELRSERLALIREKDEKDSKLALSEEKLEMAESKSRSLDLELRKALQNEEQIRSTSELSVVTAERKVSSIELDLENIKVKKEDLEIELRKVRAEVEAARKVDIDQTKKIAQLEAQVSAGMFELEVV